MTELLAKQQRFVKLLGQLIEFAYMKGWAFSLGDGFRPDGKGHMPGSLHYEKLAQDLNLFVDGRYRAEECAEWHELGSYWEGLADDCRWGGRFKIRDYNHFSIGYEGKA